MNEIHSSPTQVSAPGGDVIQQLKHTAVTMNVWLKLLGIVMIVSGTLTAFSIVGIIVAWIPIWLGVLLFQAGDRAKAMEYTDDLHQLLLLMQKLKMYFVISGAIALIAVVFTVLSVVSMFSFMEHFSKNIQEILVYYF